MKHMMAVLAGLLFVAAPLTASAQTSDDKTMQLLQRVANGAVGQADIFVGKLPNDVPNVPLPDANIVGSIHQKGDVGNVVSVDSYQVYYNAGADTLDGYATALNKAGWTLTGLPTGGADGFTPSAGNMSFYCKSGAPMITAQSNDENPSDLLVSISLSSANQMLCNGGNGAIGAAMAMLKTPLPNLKAPAGAKVTISLVPSLGQSSAYVRSSSSISDLLSAFAAQMTGAGWSSGTKTASSTLATETFSIAKEKTPWQSVLTISAIPGKPGEYAAFISAMKLP